MATQEPGRPVNELDILSNLNKKFLDQLIGLQINVKWNPWELSYSLSFQICNFKDGL